MRDPNNKLLRINCGKRRSVLVILLMSASPVLVDSSAAEPIEIRTNPFCQEAQQTNFDEVNLASGRNLSTIRLKPIGRAIGLKSLDTTETQSSLPQMIGGSKMTIESVPSVVRMNPLIDSVHHGDRELVDVEVAPADSAGTTARNQRRSTIMLMRVPEGSKRQESPVVAPLIPANLASQQSVPQLVLPAQQPLTVAKKPLPTKPESTPDGSAAKTGPQTVEQEPVLFSLSDRSDSDPISESPGKPKPERTPEPTVKTKRVTENQTAVTENILSAGVQRSKARNTVRVMPSGDEPSELSVLEQEPARIDKQVKISEPARVDATDGGISIIRSPGIKALQTNRPKRYRSPVEVKSIPIEIARPLPASTPSVPVAVVPAFHPAPVELVNASAVTPTKLTIDLAQVRSLKLGGRLQKVQVADSTVCKVVPSGPQQLKLIGTGEGITQLVVLADGKESGQKPLQRTFQIHVTDSRQVTDHTTPETCELLNQSIRETFPGCEVIVVQRDKELMVAGRCDSQSSAKKILRMVRSTCLVPVRDELIVH